MVDQVSLTASVGYQRLNRWLMNFLACGPGQPVVSRMKETRLMCGYLSNLIFSALLAISPGFVLAAETRDGLQEKGATTETSKYVTETVKVKDKIHPSVFSLSVDNTGESMYFQFNEYLGPTVLLYDVRKAPRQCSMSAVNTSTKTTTITVMLFQIERFLANDTCRTFIGCNTVPHVQS